MKPALLENKDDTTALLLRLCRHIIDMAQHSSHVAVALSCVDILAALHFRVLCPQDHFILSKGHGAMALYAVLAELGHIQTAELHTYGKDGSRLAEHPLAGKVAGIEFAAGSLGHGLAVAAGMAKGLKLSGSDGRVFVLLGDGECNEGTVWEAAGAACAQDLDNLVALVDWNGLQACGSTGTISKGVHLPDVWEAFGWSVEFCYGHDIAELEICMDRANSTGGPKVLLCKTVKGHGISFMENDLEWHYRPVNGNARDAALEELRDA
jgi:transketolase